MPLFYRYSKFFVITNGPSHTNKNLQDLQHAIAIVVRLVRRRVVRSLTLVIQEVAFHGSMWQNLDCEPIMALARLVLRREARVIVNNTTLLVLGAAGQVANIPTINIIFPPQHLALIQTLRIIFQAVASNHVMPVYNLRQFIDSRISALPPADRAPQVSSYFALPHGLIIQWGELFILPTRESEGLDVVQDIAHLGPRKARLKFLHAISHSLKTHHYNVMVEMSRLENACDTSPPPCVLAIGEGFGQYTRTTDPRSRTRLSVDLRLRYAQRELAMTKEAMSRAEFDYNFVRPLNYPALHLYRDLA